MPLSTAPSDALLEANEDGPCRLISQPPTEPLEAVHWLALFLAVLIPNLALVVLLSAMGWGVEVYDSIAPELVRLSGTSCIALAAVLLLVYWLLDWPHWTGRHKVLTAIIPWLLCSAGALLKGRKYPSFPLAMVMGQKSVFIFVVRTQIGRTVRRSSFFFLVAAFTIMAGALMLGMYFWWYFQSGGGHPWTDDHTDWAAKMPHVYEEVWRGGPLDYVTECGPRANVSSLELIEQEEIKYACEQADTILFIVWFSPVIGSFVNIMIGLFLFVHTHALNIGNSERLEGNLKGYLLLVAAIVMALCVTMQISGQFHFADAFMSFFALILVVVLGWIYMEIGPGSEDAAAVNARTLIKGNAWTLVDKQSALLQMILDLRENEWAQAFCFGTVGIIIPIYFALDILRRRIRVCTGFGRPADDTEDTFTRGATALKHELAGWHMPIILTKVLFIGEMLFLFQVGVSKGVNVFLSWMNAYLLSKHVGYVVTVGIVFGVGFLMFLLPPVPGLPVYVFAGVVLASQGESIEGIGFFRGMAIAVAMSFVLKLVASLGQYMLGFIAGRNVKVQQLIAVDSVPTRAVEAILTEPGLSLGKVAVLVGAPDWPTSVTCGIMRMNIGQMLLGTLPVFFVNTPCAIAGSYLARTNATPTDQIMANAFIALSGFVLACTAFLAIKSIAEVIERDAEELAKPREEHRAVAELTQQEQHFTDVYRDAAQWNSLGCVQRVVLLFATFCMLTSVGAFVVLGQLCFEDFAVSGKIDGPLLEGGLGGDVFNIIKPVGRCALGVFGVAVLLHVIIALDWGRSARKALRLAQHISREEPGDVSLVARGASRDHIDAVMPPRSGSFNIDPIAGPPG